MKKTVLLAFAFFALPFIASAQGANIVNLLIIVGDIVNRLIPILIGIALLVFFWGLVQYILNNSGEGHTNGRNIMIAGLIALFIMVSVWGIIRFAQSALGVQDIRTLPAPVAPTYGAPTN